jgi:hypothetical protein
MLCYGVVKVRPGAAPVKDSPMTPMDILFQYNTYSYEIFIEIFYGLQAVGSEKTFSAPQHNILWS